MTAAIRFDALARWAPQFGRVCLALALAACAITLVRLVLLLVAGPTLPVADVAPEQPFEATSSPLLADSIANWHLFGRSESLPDTVASAPETELRLFLRGTLNESVPEQGIAIISDAEGNERAYRVGETLPGEATLVAVHAARVLIDRGGRREGLSLRTDVAPPARATSGGGDGLAGSRSGASLPSVSGPPQPFAIGPLSLGVPNLEQFRDASVPNVAELARQVGVLPVLENQRMIGVRLTVGRDSDLLERYGLRTSDIITQVNGIPLDGPQRQQELLESLRGGRSVTITVRRDGGTQDIRLSP
jgi:general secretion pathway protein C